MSFLRDLKFFRVFLVISFSLVFLSTFPIKGYCDDWVYVGKTDNYLYFYNNTNININRNTKQIRVWLKYKYTEKGQENQINFWTQLHVNNYNILDHQLSLCLIDYKNNRFRIVTNNTYTKWENIIPGSEIDLILIKILDINNK